MMLSALHNEEWFVPSYPFSPFGDMESEIAELRTLTKVTKLRQQIECRQEGAWMMVRDVPDEKSKSGTRKVTSYGRATRSVTRSFCQNFTGQSMLDALNPTGNVIIEHPSENSEEKQDNSTSSVEITEVTDEQPQKAAETSTTSSHIPVKKTSVVTLGKGNLVLIDDEDSNFQVTGISKGRVADAVNTLERVAQEKNTKNGSEQEKKVKKVGFCKTEVHFAPDSGRVNIVETDEKPPPSQMLRRKKRNRIKTAKPDLPKLYFGNSSVEKIKDYSKFMPSQKGVFSVIREPSPLLTLSATAQVSQKKEDESDNYGYVKKVTTSNITTIEPPKYENNSSVSYLGNVSPKLSKLLQNSKDFQIKQKQVIKSEDLLENGQFKKLVFKNSVPSEEVHHVIQKVSCDNEVNKPLKIVTQVSLGSGGGEVEHKFVLKASHKETEPIYVNRDITVEQTSSNDTNQNVREKTPKPKPRTTVVISPQIKDVKNAKLIKQPEKVIKRVIPKTKEVPKKESPQMKPTYKQCSRNPSNKFEKKPVKYEVNTTNTKLQKLNKNSTAQEKFTAEVRVRKTKEPLRSFEKVSNGWVGHCITPVKTSLETTPREAQITVTSKIFSNKPAVTTVHSVRTQESKRSHTTSGNKCLTRSRNEEKISNKSSSLTENKQFSLSKEHLRSAKLVKELANKDIQATKSSTPLKKPNNAVSSHPNRPNTRIITPQHLRNRSASKVGVVRPRIVHQSDVSSKTSSVAVRIGVRRSEHSLLRLRRDSEQSDDSVVRADEEVRAYMFNTRHKVVIAELLVRSSYCSGGDGNYLTMPSDNKTFLHILFSTIDSVKTPVVNMLIHITVFIGSINISFKFMKAL